MITLKGIDQAIANLKFSNRKALKARLVDFIRQTYTDESSVESALSIDTDELVKMLWDTNGDYDAIKTKRKNFNSVKSALNADLNKLYQQGKNPEGIIIGPDNTFIMSEEAKDKILEKYGFDMEPGGSLSLDQLAKMLKIINETLSDSMLAQDVNIADGLKKLNQLRDQLQDLSAKIDLVGSETVEAGLKKDVDFEGRTEHSSKLGTQNIEEVDDLAEEEVAEEVEEGDDFGVEETFDTFEEVDEADAVAEDLTAEEVIDDQDFMPDDVMDTDSDTLDSIDEISEDDIAPDEVIDDVEVLADLAEEEDVEDFEETDLADEEVGEDAEEVDEFAADEVADDLEEVDELADDEVEEDVEEVAELADDEIVEDVEAIDESTDDEVIEDLEEVDELTDEDFFEDVEAGDNLGDDEVVDDAEEVDEFADDEVVEDAEEIDDLTDDEIDEDLVEVDEFTDDELGEDLEAVDNPEADETCEDAVDPEADIETEWSDDGGLPAGSLGQENSEEVSDEIKKARLLAEEFDGYLGAMDRYFNQYLLIPEGEYIIGSRQPRNGERWVQKLTLAPFYIGRFPITNGLFEIFAEKTGYKTYAEKVGCGTVYYGRIQKKKDENTGLITSTWNSRLHCEVVDGACWYQPSGPGSTLHNKRAHPVVQITLEDAMAFAAWTGKRLPTEEEWEAAARTLNGWMYPWGQAWRQDACNIEESGISDTTPVDKYVEFENDLGIADTMGNVLEWTLLKLEPVSDKDHPSEYYAAKGGSWISGNDIALFNRYRLAFESHSNILGFRCVAY